MSKNEIKKIVLAYSGGLDTSVIVPWLKENYPGSEVICFTANIGQGDELTGLNEKAVASGALKVVRVARGPWPSPPPRRFPAAQDQQCQRKADGTHSEQLQREAGQGRCEPAERGGAQVVGAGHGVIIARPVSRPEYAPKRVAPVAASRRTLPKGA